MTLATMANANELTKEWDKTFQKSDKVEHCKATFRNRFGITLAAGACLISCRTTRRSS